MSPTVNYTAGNLKRSTRQKPVYVQVANQIQQLIKDGELVPGDQLLPERELAEQIGVSRTSVRQSLAVLDGMGVIEITPRDGAYVRRKNLEDAVKPLTHVLFQERNQVCHLFEVRQIIENQAVLLAAMRRDAVDLQRLRNLNRQFEADLMNGDYAFEANTKFHLAIVGAAKNPILTEIMCTLLSASMEVYVAVRKKSMPTVDNLLQFVDEHKRIIDAIDHQDPELAVSVLTKHIDDARKRVETVMECEV